MQLHSYFQRIGFTGKARPSVDTLTELQRRHVYSIPFENLDVQLGISTSMAAEAAFEKLVGRGRGGWCYEQNGLFGWALARIGFEVTRVAAAVRRAERGESALANHLALLVRAPDDRESLYLADVGFGGSMIRPLPLEEANCEQAPFRIGLRRLDDGHWQFQEYSGSEQVTYDFLAEPGDEDAMSAQCKQLQTHPESSFVLNLVVQQRAPAAHYCLRGRTLTKVDGAGRVTGTIDSGQELTKLLRSEFQLDVPEVTKLWPAIAARHRELFGN